MCAPASGLCSLTGWWERTHQPTRRKQGLEPAWGWLSWFRRAQGHKIFYGGQQQLQNILQDGAPPCASPASPPRGLQRIPRSSFCGLLCRPSPWAPPDDCPAAGHACLLITPSQSAHPADWLAFETVEGPEAHVETAALGKTGENRWTLRCFWPEPGTSRNRLTQFRSSTQSPALSPGPRGAHCMVREGQVSVQDCEAHPGSC